MSRDEHDCQKPTPPPGTYVQLWKCPSCGEKWEFRTPNAFRIRLVLFAVATYAVGVILGLALTLGLSLGGAS